MALEHKVIQEIYDDLQSSKQAAPSYKLDCRLLISGKEVRLANVIGIEDIREYRLEHYPIIIVDATVPFPTYKSTIYPGKENLYLEIKFVIVSSKGEYTETNESFVRRYKAFLLDPTDPVLTPTDRQEAPAGEEGLSNQSNISLQLCDEFAYEMKYVDVGNIYPKTNVKTLIQVLMGYKLTGNDSKAKLGAAAYSELRGVDVYPPDNNETRTFIIPGYSSMLDLPKLLQDGSYGIYNTDVGSFYQKHYETQDNYQTSLGGHWFIYPIYNFNRYKDAPRKLNIFLAPEKEFTNLERTFTYYNKQLFIFSTGKKANLDYGEYGFFNNGNGIVFGKASELVDGLTYVSGNRVFPNTSQTKREFVTQLRDDGINDIRAIQGNYTENPYHYASKLSKNGVRVLTCMWTNSMPDLLIPGMPTKIMYLDNNDVVEALATLVKVETKYISDDTNYTDPSYTLNSILTFILEPKK